MFEVTIGTKKYNRELIESISVYSDGEEELHVWISFNKDVSKLVGLPISISSSSIKNFVGEVDSVSEQTEHICKLYCIGSSTNSNEEKLEEKVSSSPKKQANKSKKKT